MPLHTDFRPATLKDFVGNRSMVESLESVLSKQKLNHTYLFSGPSGCGKTTLARIAANMIGCSGYDLKELNAANFRGIDSARVIIKQSQTSSLAGGRKGWIIDEAHKLTNEAQNALLKVLEEPPQHVFFFLCTTDSQKLLKTIHSRCVTFEVSALTKKQTEGLIEAACGYVNKTIPDEVLSQIATSSQGAPREALTLLEKVIDLPESKMLRAAKQAVDLETQAVDLCKALIARNSWAKVSKIISGLKNEEEESLRQMIIKWSAKCLLSGDEQAYLVFDAFRHPFYDTGWWGFIVACYESVMDDGEE